MKKLIILFLVVIPFICKSQTDTTHIPVKVAKQVVNDLIDYDSKKIELGKTKEVLKLTEEVVVSRDSSITIYKNKEVNYLKQIATEKENSKLWEKQYIQMQDKYTREKSKRKLERVGSIVISGLLGYLYISK